MADLRRVEFVALSDGDWQSALDAVATALAAVDTGGLVRTDPAVLTDEARLKARAISAGRRALSSATLGPDGTEAFDRLLTERRCRRPAGRAGRWPVRAPRRCRCPSRAVSVGEGERRVTEGTE